MKSRWPIASLYDFCNPKQWPTIPQTAFVEKGYPVYGANGVIGFYTEFNHEKRTVLITCRGATCGTINVCEPNSYVTGNAMALDDLDETRVSTEYLVYALRNGSLRKAITGTAQPQITRESLTAISIPVPTLSEQRRIADILDRADALRARRRAALARLDSLTQSIFLDLFGDPAANPKGWPVLTLANCTKQIQIGPFGSLLHQEDYVSDGVPLINPKHIVNGAIITNPSESITLKKHAALRLYHLQEGDVVMGRRGEMGRSAVVDSKHANCLCGTGSLFIRPDEARTTPLFLHATLSSEQIKKRLESLSLGVTLPNLNSRIVEELTIALPPVKLQLEFAHRVAAVEKLKAAQRASLAELGALFASLQHRAFRGEL